VSYPLLRTKIYADGADVEALLRLAQDPAIRGFTTNPTLMRKAGITDYERFARQVLAEITDRPVSFEVLCDELAEMERQARTIAGWGPNVFVKIPVSTTDGTSTAELAHALSHDGIQVNVTALLTLPQVERTTAALAGGAAANVSVFAGRIADTGRDPLPVMRSALGILREAPNAELIWASPREVLNVVQAERLGCHIITVTSEILGKLHLLGKDLEAFSLETVEMFFRDASAAGLSVDSATTRA
jgi:transaldolase